MLVAVLVKRRKMMLVLSKRVDWISESVLRTGLQRLPISVIGILFAEVRKQQTARVCHIQETGKR